MSAHITKSFNYIAKHIQTLIYLLLHSSDQKLLEWLNCRFGNFKINYGDTVT